MKNGVLIRDFGKSDLEDLLELFPMCFTKEFEVTGFDPDHVRKMVNRAFGITGRLFFALSRVVGKEPMRFFVAEADGRVVGTTIVNNRGKVGYISSVMVHPELRRKGLATRLLKEAVAYIRSKGMSRAVLHVDSENAPAKSLYFKMGFSAFEHIVYFLAEMNALSASEENKQVGIRPIQKSDLDEVYSLLRASEDPNRLKIFGFSKNDLKTPVLQRLMGTSTLKKMVAVLDGKIAGYVETSYTTPRQAGHIGLIQAFGQSNSGEVERALIAAGIDEVRRGEVDRVRVTVSSVKQGLIETLKDLGFREALAMDGMSLEL